MLKNRGGRKSWLIYSMLTIIVLISISGECASRQIESEKTPPSGECLLVTAAIIKLGNGNEGYESCWSKETSEEIRRQARRSDLMWMDLDGEEILKDKHGNFRKWVEFSPGHHTLARVPRAKGKKIYMESDYDPADKAAANLVREFDAAAHEVYVVFYTEKQTNAVRTEGTKTVGFLITWQDVITVLKTNLRYDQTTGSVTHPTDSNLSFKVK